jgi:NADP-dependent 3-hydroxy acid dehydrogenase YdfG
MAISLTNKVVLITGASSGFGKDAAHLFAAEGAKVVLSARRLDRLQRLADEIRRLGGEALAVPVDVSERAAIDLMVQTVLEIYGHIDILYNNAGFGRLTWLENMDPESDIEMQLRVNLVGLIQVTRAVLPHMLDRQSGHIINMASIAGWLAAPSYTVYAASKFGVRGFTEALRREVAPFGVRVSGIYPGPSSTEFGWRAHGEEKPHRPHWQSMTYIPAEQVAECVLQLAKNPRHSVILPWWFVPIVWADNLFKGIVDGVIRVFYTDRKHKPEKK